MSYPIVGLLDGDRLDEIYHVIELVLLGIDPWYPLCSKIVVAMTLLCLMHVTRCRCTRVGVPYYPELVHGQLQRPAARLAG